MIMGLIAADSFIFKQDNGKGPEKCTCRSKGRPHNLLSNFAWYQISVGEHRKLPFRCGRSFALGSPAPAGLLHKPGKKA